MVHPKGRLCVHFSGQRRSATWILNYTRSYLRFEVITSHVLQCGLRFLCHLLHAHQGLGRLQHHDFCTRTDKFGKVPDTAAWQESSGSMVHTEFVRLCFKVLAVE